MKEKAISRLMQEGFVVQNHNSGPCIISFTKEQELEIIQANLALFQCVFEFLEDIEDLDGLIRELEQLLQDTVIRLSLSLQCRPNAR